MGRGLVAAWVMTTYCIKKFKKHFENSWFDCDLLRAQCSHNRITVAYRWPILIKLKNGMCQ